MSRHEGVSCDVCMGSNFGGRRLKCLVCFDFDLCGPCFDAGQTGASHTKAHPVQCILTPSDVEMFHGGDAAESGALVGSLTCPLCGDMGFSAADLAPHIADRHPGPQAGPVICPICASAAAADPNRMTAELAVHLGTWHEGLDSLPSSASSRGGRRSVGSRGPQRQTAVRGRSAARLPFHHREDLTASLSGSGEADPIAELLGQLGGMRRPNANYASTLSQIHQLQQQLGRGSSSASSRRSHASTDQSARASAQARALAAFEEANGGAGGLFAASAAAPPPPPGGPPPVSAAALPAGLALLAEAGGAVKLARKSGATAMPAPGGPTSAAASKDADILLLPKLMAERRLAAEAGVGAAEKARRREMVADVLVASLQQPIETLLPCLPECMRPEEGGEAAKENHRPAQPPAPTERKPHAVAVVAPTPAPSNGRPTAMVAPHPQATPASRVTSPSAAPAPAPPPTVNVTPNPAAADQTPPTGVVVGLPAGGSGSGENYAVVSTASGSARMSRGASSSSVGGAGPSSGTSTEASLIRASSSASAASSSSGPTPV